MQDRNYKIRTVHRDEVQIAVEWATREGWNPGTCDADCFYATDPNGFLIGLLDGYGVIRRCRSGYKIGPLFADSPPLRRHDLRIGLKLGLLRLLREGRTTVLALRSVTTRALLTYPSTIPRVHR